MRTTRRKAILTALLLAGQSAIVSAQTRLLPDSVTRTLRLQWKQDGRAVDVEVQNPPGNWVVTELLLEVNYRPIEGAAPSAFHLDSKGQIRPGPAPRKPGTPSLNYEAVDNYLRNLPAKFTVKTLVQPGKKAPTVIELSDESPVSHILIIEARGREPTTFERLKNAVQ